MEETAITKTIAGGCACGGVRYQSDVEIEFAFHCHCRRCQRATGGGHSSAFALARDRIELTGELSEFEQQADSGYTTLKEAAPRQFLLQTLSLPPNVQRLFPGVGVPDLCRIPGAGSAI